MVRSATCSAGGTLKTVSGVTSRSSSAPETVIAFNVDPGS